MTYCLEGSCSIQLSYRAVPLFELTTQSGAQNNEKTTRVAKQKSFNYQKNGLFLQ